MAKKKKTKLKMALLNRKTFSLKMRATAGLLTCLQDQSEIKTIRLPRLVVARKVSVFSMSDPEVTCGDSHVKTNVSETLVYKLSALSDESEKEQTSLLLRPTDCDQVIERCRWEWIPKYVSCCFWAKRFLLSVSWV